MREERREQEEWGARVGKKQRRMDPQRVVRRRIGGSGPRFLSPLRTNLAVANFAASTTSCYEYSSKRASDQRRNEQERLAAPRTRPRRAPTRSRAKGRGRGGATVHTAQRWPTRSQAA